jgi:O-antigen ligase
MRFFSLRLQNDAEDEFSPNMLNYIINLKNSQNYNKIIKILVVFSILSLFFPIRHVFLTKEAYLTGSYSDFTSFSLYLSDILIFLLALMVFLPRGGVRSLIVNRKLLIVNPLFWLILALLIVFLIHFGLNIRLNAYLLIKWLELIVAYGTFRLLFKQDSIKTLFLKLFAWLCGLESIIALVQFAKQSSIGLYRLGESHLAPNILGVAKIVSGETTFIRGYGTFPHPNPLSAFLVVGILITIYLLTLSENKKLATIYSILLFLNILGLTVTFSRGAYLALVAGLIIFFGLLFFRRHPDPERVHPSEGEGSQTPIKRSFTPRMHLGFRMTPVVVTAVSIIVTFFLFEPFLITRATFSDQSTIAREFYDVTGVKMALKNPIFGLGLGESMLHMKQYSHKSLAPWDKQPPHNYFIIAAAELGLPAMLILVWVFLSHLWGLIKKLRTNKNFLLSPFSFLLISIFCTFLVLMMFDHYFYDLNQTQLLLWIFLALISSAIQNPSPRNGEGQGRG